MPPVTRQKSVFHLFCFLLVDKHLSDFLQVFVCSQAKNTNILLEQDCFVYGDMENLQ